MDTKLKSDIAEAAVVFELLRKGLKVLRPVGDRLPYDLGVDRGGRLVRVQVKSAWSRADKYIVDCRRTRTNRRRMVRARYRASDFDYAVLYIQEKHVFYILPSRIFCRFGSEITLCLRAGSKQRPVSDRYRERWDYLVG